MFNDIRQLTHSFLAARILRPEHRGIPMGDEELALLSACDTDPFARWEAGQELATREILGLTAARHAGCRHEGQSRLHLRLAGLAGRSRAWMPPIGRGRLSLPSEKRLAERMAAIDPPIVGIRARISCGPTSGSQLASACARNLRGQPDAGTFIPAAGTRGQTGPEEGLALSHLMAGGDADAAKWALDQYEHAGNMTDRLGALTALVNHGDEDAATACPEPLLRAMAAPDPPGHRQVVRTAGDGALDHCGNRARPDGASRFHAAQSRTAPAPWCSSFASNNARGLHGGDGSGYVFWGEQVLALDA